MKNLVMFTCSTINDKYMFDQEKPWLYVSLNPAGNNLENDLPVLKKLPAKLTILIGNTDPYYIYTKGFSVFNKLSKPKLWQKFAVRWNKYRQNLVKWLDDNGLTDVEVISWYQFEKTLESQLGLKFETIFNRLLPDIDKYFPAKAFAWEKSRLKQAFAPGKYFSTLPIPDDKTLDIWIKRKFTEYMLQGLFISIFFPDSTLLQNENPSTLRSSMYQPLIKKYLNKQLPIIYPFGIDDLNYQ